MVCRATGRARVVTTGGTGDCASGNYQVAVSTSVQTAPGTAGPPTSHTVYGYLPGQSGLRPDSSCDASYVIEWAFPQQANAAVTYKLNMFQSLTGYSGGFVACLAQGSCAINHIVGFSCQSVIDE